MADTGSIQGTLGSLGISLGIGLLVGLQREWAGSRLAGVRTFPLVTMLGTLSAMLAEALGGWVLAGGILAVAITMGSANLMILRQEGRRETGMTTEVAIILMFIVGAYAAIGEGWVVLAAGAAVAILLYLKPGLHTLADKIGDKDMRAILLFAAITFIVLPVLPDETFGPYDVWNPRTIWLVVVLVVGISLGGYIAYKVLGGEGGTLAAGLLGGLVSSTATTVSYARRAAAQSALSGPAVLVIAIATCVAYARVLAEIGAVSGRLFRAGALPIGVMAATGLAATAAAWFLTRKTGDQMPEPQNPTQLRPALLFAAVLSVVLLAVAAARERLGAQGMYAVAALGGLVDLDAITLSNASEAERSPEMAGSAWRGIIVAIISNLMFKLGLVGALGGGRLVVARLAAIFGAQVAAGLLILALWPR